MIKAWYLDDSNKSVSIEKLQKETGVEYIKLNMDTYLTDGVLDNIKKQRGYTYEDVMTCNEGCEDYKEKISKFITEHLHSDEEIRLVVEGSGYFDVRDAADRWIRIEVIPGDMIVLPKGIYHRFSLTNENNVKVRRFFIGEPVWCGYNRPADDMSCRQDYVNKLANGFETSVF